MTPKDAVAVANISESLNRRVAALHALLTQVRGQHAAHAEHGGSGLLLRKDFLTDVFV